MVSEVACPFKRNYYGYVFFYTCHTFCMRNRKSDILNPLGEGSHFNTVISNEEQRSLSPSSDDTIRCSSLGSQGYLFSEETMQGLRELGAVLQDIHNRLIAEGYSMKDGQLIKPNEQTANN